MITILIFVIQIGEPETACRLRYTWGFLIFVMTLKNCTNVNKKKTRKVRHFKFVWMFCETSESVARFSQLVLMTTFMRQLFCDLNASLTWTALMMGHKNWSFNDERKKKSHTYFLHFDVRDGLILVIFWIYRLTTHTICVIGS